MIYLTISEPILGLSHLHIMFRKSSKGTNQMITSERSSFGVGTSNVLPDFEISTQPSSRCLYCITWPTNLPILSPYRPPRSNIHGSKHRLQPNHVFVVAYYILESITHYIGPLTWNSVTYHSLKHTIARFVSWRPRFSVWILSVTNIYFTRRKGVFGLGCFISSCDSKITQFCFFLSTFIRGWTHVSRKADRRLKKSSGGTVQSPLMLCSFLLGVHKEIFVPTLIRPVVHYSFNMVPIRHQFFLVLLGFHGGG